MSGWGLFNSGYGSLLGRTDVYGSLNLTVQSPVQQFQEPLTVEEVVYYLRTDPNTDDNRYNEIAGFISAAREQAEILQGRDLVIKQRDLTFDFWPSYRVALRSPLVSVDLVQYTDNTGAVTVLAPTTGFVVDLTKQPGTISPPYDASWPTFTSSPSSAVLIRFTSGYAATDAFWSDAGARIKMGMKQLISLWDSNRIPCEIGSNQAMEYPYAVTSCLSYGSIVRAR